MKLFINDEEITGEWEVGAINEIVRNNIDGVMVATILTVDHYTLKVEGKPERRFKLAELGLNDIILSDEVSI